jgi:hypothetical protein
MNRDTADADNFSATLSETSNEESSCMTSNSEPDHDSDEVKNSTDENEVIDDDEYCELLQGEFVKLKEEVQSNKQKHKLILSQYDDLLTEQKALQQQKMNNDTFHELSSQFFDLRQQLVQLQVAKQEKLQTLIELQHNLELYGTERKSTTTTAAAVPIAASQTPFNKDVELT